MTSNEENSEKSEEVSSKKDEILEIEKKLNDSKPKDEKKIIDNINKQEKSINNKNSNKTKNQKLWIVIAITTMLVLIFLFSTAFALLNLGKTTIAKGVSIKGIDVSNLTIEEATNKVNEAINIELLLKLNLKYNDDYEVNFDPNQIQYTYEISSAIKEAYSVGRTDNIIKNNYELLYSAFFGKDVGINVSFNEDSLNKIIDDISSKLPGIVVQPSYYIEGNQLIINNGKVGIQVDKEKLKNDILENIKNRNAFQIMQNDREQELEIKVNKSEPEKVNIEKIYNEIYTEPKDAYYIANPFQLFPEENGVDFAVTMEEANAIVNNKNQDEYIIPLKITPAQKTVDDIGTEAFPYLISSFTTKYDASNVNRSGNLKIAADKINGTVLMPGQEFSFNEIVGKRTIEDGYKNAKIYENGQVIDGLAGGICQISSTLYNVALLANLEITQRRNHSYTTSYVPAGRDATVVYGTQDFRFKNSRTYPIKIEAKVANGIVEFKVHGIKEEIEYEIKIIPITTQTIPYQTEYVPDATIAPGQQIIKQVGHSGYKVTTYIEKRLAGTVISKDILSNDTYNAMKMIINVGP